MPIDILILEDNVADAELVRRELRKAGFDFTVRWIRDKAGFAAALETAAPDLILADYSLPGFDGLTALRLARQRWEDVPVIIVSGAIGEELAIDALKAGATDYVLKQRLSRLDPVVRRALQEAAEVARRKQAQSAMQQAHERLQEQAEELQSQAEELRVQAEELATVNETLRKSETQLLLAMEAGKVGVWEWEVGTEHVEWSQGIYALLGYPPGTVIPSYQALHQRIHPQDLARHDQVLNDSLERCEDYLCEFRVIWADGPVHWVESRGQYVYLKNQNGINLRMRGVLSDIDRRKQAEEALQESERKFKSTFENAAVGIAHVALDGHILQFNRRFCEIAGYRPEEIVGKTCEEITFADDWKAERVQMQRLLDGQVDHYAIEKRYLRMDGSPVWVSLTRSIQHGEAGRPEYFIVLVEDISARRRVEEALRASEQRYRKLFEANLAGVYLTRLDGTILDFNDAMMRMLGYDSREELSQHRSSDFYADPEFRQEFLRLLQKDGIVPAQEAVLRRKDGSLLYALGAGVLLADEQTGERYIQGVAIDITERKQAEAELYRLNEELERRVEQRTAALRHRTRQLQKLALEMSEAEDRERERLAHILHDDLQQELAAAKFHLSVVRNRTRHDSAVQEILAKVEGMLKEAIGRSRSLSHELSPVVLHQGDFGQALQWLAGQIQAKHGLVVRVHGQAYSLSAPLKAFLYRTAQELLFNAVKHAQVQEARVRVRECRGHICLSVADRGRGFDPGELRETAGFGLLSIRERVELLGGRMKIRSAPGKGSTFFVVVPGATPARDTAEAGSRAYPTPSGRGGPPLRVLLADDHEVVRQGLIALLGDEDTVEVVGEAANGREAVDLAGQLHPDVVLMDVSMPVMSGEEATRRIKQDLPRTRIVSLSMRAEPEVRERMHEAGAESYVLKTAPYKELLAAIRGRGADAQESGMNLS